MEALSGSPTTNPSPCSGKDRFLDPKSILCGQRRGDENPSSFRCCPAAATVCPRCASSKLRRRCDGLPTMCRRRESYDLVSQAAPPRAAAGPRGRRSRAAECLPSSPLASVPASLPRHPPPPQRYVDIIFVKWSVVEVKWGVFEVWEHHSELADQLKGRPARSS
nr:uncharacterized protein LOC127344323 isoform X2 [Lolium perenne]